MDIILISIFHKMLNVNLIASQFKVSEQKKDYINSINNTER